MMGAVVITVFTIMSYSWNSKGWVYPTQGALRTFSLCSQVYGKESQHAPCVRKVARFLYLQCISSTLCDGTLSLQVCGRYSVNSL
jgi:hypothetical protein